VRKHFRAEYDWPKKHETGILRNQVHDEVRHGIFVMIDEEMVKTLLDAQMAILEIPVGSIYWFVTEKEADIAIKVVEVDYDEECEWIQFAAAGRATPKDSLGSATIPKVSIPDRY
jgi:hypothetical protein